MSAEELEKLAAGGHIDLATFEQILEMDDDEKDREFSQSIVRGFLDQAETTITKLYDALGEKDMNELSMLGHFFKGSSATLGLSRIRDSCEKIQHFGAFKDEKGNNDLKATPEDLLPKIKNLVDQVKDDCGIAGTKLKEFYKWQE